MSTTANAELSQYIPESSPVYDDNDFSEHEYECECEDLHSEFCKKVYNLCEKMENNDISSDKYLNLMKTLMESLDYTHLDSSSKEERNHFEKDLCYTYRQVFLNSYMGCVIALNDDIADFESEEEGYFPQFCLSDGTNQNLQMIVESICNGITSGVDTSVVDTRLKNNSQIRRVLTHYFSEFTADIFLPQFRGFVKTHHRRLGLKPKKNVYVRTLLELEL